MWCFQFIQSVECKGHTGPICAADAIYVEDSKILVASSASDSTVKLWLCCDAKEGKRQKNVNELHCPPLSKKKERKSFQIVIVEVAVIPEIDSYSVFLFVLLQFYLH